MWFDFNVHERSLRVCGSLINGALVAPTLLLVASKSTRSSARSADEEHVEDDSVGHDGDEDGEYGGESTLNKNVLNWRVFRAQQLPYETTVPVQSPYSPRTVPVVKIHSPRSFFEKRAFE